MEMINNLAKTAIIGTALAGGALVYDEMTPPAATYFQEVQVAPKSSPSTPLEEGFVYSKVESDPLPLKSNSVTVDLVGTGPPVQDDYPRGPQPDSSSTNQTNFGLVRH